jgi:hypothetical protein
MYSMIESARSGGNDRRDFDPGRGMPFRFKNRQQASLSLPVSEASSSHNAAGCLFC